MLNTFFYQMILNAKLDNNKIKKRKKKTKQNFNQIRPKTRQKQEKDIHGNNFKQRNKENIT